MAFRSKEVMKKIVKSIGGEKNLASGDKQRFEKYVPNAKVVMGRGQLGLLVGRHIQFGNWVSEKGGNTNPSIQNLWAVTRDSLRRQRDFSSCFIAFNDIVLDASLST